MGAHVQIAWSAMLIFMANRDRAVQSTKFGTVVPWYLYIIKSDFRRGAPPSLAGQTAFFRFSLWWQKKGSGPVHRRFSS